MNRLNMIFSFPVLDDLAQIGFGMVPFHFRSHVEILPEVRSDFSLTYSASWKGKCVNATVFSNKGINI